jgi:ankyrin repeat protein
MSDPAISYLVSDCIAKPDTLKNVVNSGRVALVVALLRNGLDIHVHDDLMIKTAAERGDNMTVSTLLYEGVGVNHKALKYAIEKGHLHVVETLLKAGAKPDDKCLTTAIEYERSEVLKLLLKLNIFDQKEEDISEAVCTGNVGIVEILISAGYPTSSSLLVKSVYNGYADISRLLINTGVKFDSNNDKLITSLLITAAAKGHLDVVNIILKCGNGLIPTIAWTGISHACEYGHLNVVKACSAVAVATKNIPNRYYDHLYYAAKVNHVDMVNYLLETYPKMFDIEEALKEAVISGHIEIVKILMPYKPNLKLDMIDYAIRYDQLETVKFLYEPKFADLMMNKATNNCQIGKDLIVFLLDQGMSPTKAAFDGVCIWGHVDIVSRFLAMDTFDKTFITSRLLYNVADRARVDVIKLLCTVDVMSSRSIPMLIEALISLIKTGEARGVKCLLDSGLDMTGNYGRVALLLAASGGRDNIVKLMLNTGVDNSHIDIALTEAANIGSGSVVKVLLQYNPSHFAINTAFMNVVQNRDIKTMNIILASGEVDQDTINAGFLWATRTKTNDIFELLLPMSTNRNDALVIALYYDAKVYIKTLQDNGANLGTDV